MIKNIDNSNATSILRSISMSIVGMVVILVVSCWIGQTLISAGTSKEELNIIFLAIFAPAILLGFVGLVIISYIPFPKYNEKIEYYINSSFGKVLLCLLTGAINIVLILILFQIPVIKILALAFFIIYVSIGLSNISKIIGDRIYLIANEETTPFRSLVTGIILLEILNLLPIVGQILFVVAILIGLGGTIIALFIKKSGEPNSIHQIEA
ncbi:MAG: hypothetical protein AB1782_01920 [Cyanobacteriota bacterium]